MVVDEGEDVRRQAGGVDDLTQLESAHLVMGEARIARARQRFEEAKQLRAHDLDRVVRRDDEAGDERLGDGVDRAVGVDVNVGVALGRNACASNDDNGAIDEDGCH